MTLALALTVIAATSDGGSAAAQLQSTMRLNLSAVARLQPYLVSPIAFRDPKHLAAMKADLDVLGRLEHQFQKGKKGFAADAIAELFAQQVKRARFELNKGEFEASRMRLHGLTGMCLGCHQRQQAEKEFSDAAKTVNTLKLTSLQRAEFYAVTRQFDRAMKTWGEALAEKPANEAEAMEQARGIRTGLGVAVRALDDPKAALALLTPQLGRKDLPGFVRANVDRWAQACRDWEKEKLSAASLEPAQGFEKAKALLVATGALDSVVPDEAQVVSYLRAAAYLNAALTKARDVPWRTEAMYLLGVASSAVSDPILWELDGLYLEACVRDAPHTPMARTCVERLGDRMALAYTSRAGLEMPLDVSEKLGMLRELAK